MSTPLIRRMSLSTLTRRVNTLDQKLHPAPTIIDAGKAKEDVLRMLEMQMAKGEEEGEEEEEKSEWTPKDEATAQQLSIFLEEESIRIQREYNIKLVGL